MACFLVPAGEAVVTEIVTKVMEKKSTKTEKTVEIKSTDIEAVKIPFTRKLHWLTRMLSGGAALLAFEHVWHGEVVPFFPFLTATTTADGTSGMLYEMSTTGVSMAVVVTGVWCVMLVVSKFMEKNYIKDLSKQKTIAVEKQKAE